MAEVNEEVCDSPKEVASCIMALKRDIMELESSLRILQRTFEQNYGPFSSTGNRKNGGKFRNISEKCNDVDESRFTDTTDQGHKRHSQSLCTGYPPDHEHNRELEFNTSEIDTSQTTDPDNSEHFIANAHESSIQSILAHSKDEKEWKPFSEEQCLYRRHSEGIVFPEIDRIIYANHRKRNHIYEHKPDPIEMVSSNENASDEFFPVEDEMGSEEDLETLDRIETVALNENASNGLLSLEDEEIEVSKMEAETVENAEDSCELKNDLNDSSGYNTSCEDMEEKEEESCPKQVQIQDCIESCNSGFCGLNINSQIDEDESCTQAVINHSHITTETDTDTDTGTSSENPTLDTPEFPMHDRVTEDGMTPNNGSSKSQCYTCPDLIGKDVPVIQDICQLDKVTNKEDNHAQNACQPHYQSVRHIECEPERELCTHCQSQNDHKSDLPLRPIHVAPDMGFTQNRNITVASMMDNFYSSHGEAIQECPQQLLTTWESSPREGNLHGLLQSENVGRVTPFDKQKYVSNCDRSTPSISVTLIEEMMPIKRNAFELQPTSRCFEMFSQGDTAMKCLMNALAFNETARTSFTTNELKIPQTDSVQFANTTIHCIRRVLLLIRLDHGCASYDVRLLRTELALHTETSMATKNGQGTFCILPLNAKRHVSDLFLCRTPNDQRLVNKQIQVNNDMMQLKGQRQDNFRLFILLDQQLLPNKGFRKEDMTEQSDYLEEGSQSKLHIRPWVKMKDKDNAQQYTRKPYKFAAPVKEIDQQMLLVHATGTTEKPSDHRVLHEQPNLDESDGHTGHKRKMGTSTKHNKEISNPTVPFKKDSLPKVVLELKSTTTCHKRLDIRNMKDGSMNRSHTLPALRRGVYRAQRDNESSSCQSNSETKSNNCSNTNDGKANKVDRGTSSKDNGDDDQNSVLGQSVHESNTKISIKEGSFEKGIEISGISVTNIQVGDECQALLQMDDTDTSTSINERNVAIDRPENVTVLEAPTSTNEKDVVRDYVTDLFEDKFDPSPLDGGKGTGSKMDPLTLFLCCTQRYMKTDGIASIILMLINQMGMWVKVYSDKDASANQLPSIRSKNRGESIHIDFKKCEYGTKHSLNLQVGRANTMHVRCSMMKSLRGRCWFIPWFKSRPPLYGQDSYVKTITDRFNTMARHPQISWRNHDHMVFKIEFSMDLIHTLYEAAKAKVIKMVIKHHSQNDCTLLGNHSMPEGQCTILRPDRFAGRQNHTLSSISDFNVHNSFDISSDIKDAADGNVVFGGSHHFDVNSVEDEDENTYVDVDTNLVVDRLISGFHCIGDRFSDNDCHVPSTICNDCSSLNVVRKTTPDNVFSDQIEALSSGIHHDFLDSAIKQIVQVLNDSESFSALLHILDVQICSITDSGVYYLRSDNLSEVLTNLDNSYVQELLFEVLKGTELVAGVCINEAKDISPSFELRSRD